MRHLDAGFWIGVGAWLVLASALVLWLRGRGVTRLSSWAASAVACLVACCHVMLGAMILWGLRYSIVLDDPAGDAALRLTLGALGVMVLLVGAWLLRTGVAMGVRLRKKTHGS